MLIKRVLVVILFIGLAPLAFQACSNAKFDVASAPATVVDNNHDGIPDDDVGGQVIQNPCNNQWLTTITTPVKFLMVVDTSESNAGLTDENGIYHPPTDAGKVMRGGSIQAFFDHHQGKTNFSWGFISFAGSTANAIIKHNGLPGFSAMISDMQSAIIAFRNIVDIGMTPYRAAIQMSTQALSNDAGTNDTKYVIVFLSDGMPTDYDYPGTETPNDPQIGLDVAALVATKGGGRVSFNTVYYGPAKKSASDRLAMMATQGHGQFIDTNAHPEQKDFVIDNVVTVPGSGCVQ